MEENRNKNNLGRLFFALLLIAILLLFLVDSLHYQRVAKVFPLMVIIPTLILVAIEALITIRILVKERTLPKTNQDSGSGELIKEFKAHIWVLFVLFSFFFFGIIITTAVFPFIYMAAQKDDWGAIMGVTAGLVGSSYLLFTIILRIPLYRGFLFELIFS